MLLLGSVWLTLAIGQLSAGWLGRPAATAGSFAVAAVLAGRAFPRASWRGAASGAALLCGIALGFALGACFGDGARGRGHPLLAVSAVVLAPFFEEIVYRQRLLVPLRRRLGAVSAVLISAVLFAASHLSWDAAASLAAAGVLLALLRLVSRSLAPCWGAHAGFNLGALAWAGGLVPAEPAIAFALAGACLAVAFDHACRLEPCTLTLGTFGLVAAAALLALPTRPAPAPVRWLWSGDPASSAPADAFFLHPTVERGGAADAVIQLSLDNQARALKRCCRVHAPRYRAASTAELLGAWPAARRARRDARQDVRRAFEAFLAERDSSRPLVLAGHSQGAYHALSLLADYLGGARRRQLAVAYLVGIPIPAEALPERSGGVPVCRTPAQHGCLVVWNAVESEATGRIHRRIAQRLFGSPRELVCVNPLSWYADERPAGAARHLGTELRLAGARGAGWIPGVAIGARCRAGLLVIEPPGAPFDRARGPDASHHLAEFTLFHRNIEQNAVLRVRAHGAARQW